jgi:CheY-like chemotaxis protein
LKILIADDNNTDRLILSRVLENFGHQVIQATDGNHAISQFNEHKPALILLDVIMPGCDGYEVAEIIKKDTDRNWFPIIFLTSLTEASDLAKCIEVGGDDFVSKPINKIIIKAKLESFERLINLYNTVEEQHKKIDYHHQHLIQEQEAAKRIFNNIAHRGCLESSNVNYLLSPMSIFNGDVMLAAELPMGGQRFMLADFTGHGLPAAIGAMPASEIFYGMTTKGFSISDMMIEMNQRLYTVLPRGIFCCVIVFDIDPLGNRLDFWNAGAPDAYLINTEDQTIEAIASTHLPLGIQSPEKFEVITTSFEFTERHKMIVATDGIIEAEDKNTKMYGEQRMLDCIKKNITQQNIRDALLIEVKEFCGGSEQSDDLSLLEVSLPPVSNKEKLQVQDRNIAVLGTLDSKLTLQLRAKSLGNFDPIPLFLQTLLSCNELGPHRARIFTVLSELYNNALDHGVLGLDSAIKSSSSGFSEFYQKKMDGLRNINSGYVKLSVDHKPMSNGGHIIFEITDSGSGFNVDKIVKEGCKDYSGRGLPLLLSLCDSVEYFDAGTKVQAIYSWVHDEVPD